MTATASDRLDAALSSRRAALAIAALAVGGFTIGTTEFVTMGVLPEIADGVDVSIAAAGNVISAYALGVVVGAPLLAFVGARLPRRGLLLGLMAAYAAFNAASALAPSYAPLLLARFLDGLPHGGYFGVASLVAAGLVPPERRGRAIAYVLMGLPVATVVGVPAATVLGQGLGWRASFWLVAALGALTVGMVALFVPSAPGNPEATGRSELRGLVRGQVWFAILAGAVGFGGMFALFSYIAPVVTRVGELGQGAVPVFLLVLGVGMVFGNWLAGRLVDWSLSRSLLGAPVALAVALGLFWVLIPFGWWALPAAFLAPTVGSVLALGLMLRLIDAAGHAETLGAAVSHASLNVGNALGAWLGGLVIAAGHGYRSPLVVGVALALAGFVVLGVAAWVEGPAEDPVGSGESSEASRS